MISVLSPVAATAHGTNADVHFDYIINSIHLSSGTYYLQVRVTDGNNNTTFAYHTINLTAVPQQLKGFFAVTIPSSGNVSLFKCDTTWNATPGGQFTSDFTDLAVSSYWQQVYIDGTYTGLLRAISIDGSTPGWTQTPLISTQPYWGPMSVYDASLWVSFSSAGRQKELKNDGSTIYSFNSDLNYLFEHQLEVNDRVYTEQKDISSSNVKMVVYTTTGAGLQEASLNVNAVGMFAKDYDNVYIAGNSAGQGHLLIYDFTTNGCWEPVTLPAGTVTTAAQVDSQTLLIGMSNGTVYKFTYNPIGLLTWMSGMNATQLRYDTADSTVFSAEGLNVKQYDLASTSLLHTVPLPDSVRDLELWYNR